MKSKLEWVVIRARPNQERKAAANVEHAGYDSYAPRFRQYGKIKPLFIGYAFARIPIKNWGFVKRIRGVRGVLMADDEPSIVRKDIIEEIKERQDDSGLVAMEKGFTLRQRVRIVGGAFSEGLYLGMSDKHRVRVLFELLGKELTKDINIKRVRPLEAHLQQMLGVVILTNLCENPCTGLPEVLLNQMVDEFKKYVKNSTGVVVAVFIFLFAQFVFVISWGTQQASRITALETLTTQNGAIIRTWAEFSRGLGERVDRQETPLSRRVDALDLRVGVLSERSVRMDSFMLEIQREIQQRR